VNWARQASRIGGVTVRPTEMNGQPGAMFLDPDGKLISVMGLHIAAGRIQAVRSIVNPDKLPHLGPVADLRALLRGAG
jgi:RNA polymerase sigma-70 factor (ECF subfamily)